MKKIYIKWGNYHVLNCRACFDKKRRGYKSEIKYWDDFFDKKLNPIKYKLIKLSRKGLELKFKSPL